jgi:CheY-like chemotaxis protein
VRDGQEALDFLFCKGHWIDRERVPPAFVILDLKMPRVDGLDVLKAIRDSAILHHLPVVVLTASREQRDAVRAYEYGVNVYVVKPIEFTEFKRTVMEIARTWAVSDALPPAGRESTK